MSTNPIWNEIKEALQGRPGQPIVLGVGQALAARLGREAWMVRLVIVLLGLVWTLPVLAGYIVIGLLLPETDKRSRDFFTGLAVVAREGAARVTATLSRIFSPGNASDDRSY